MLVLAGGLTQAGAAGASPAGTATFFSTGIDPEGHPSSITAGPDGNMWFTESGGDRVGRITPTGTITEFTAGISHESQPETITAGPDGNLWFTEVEGNRIGRITPGGAVTEFTEGISPGSKPWGITAGPDGNLWFTERAGNRIGRITPAGKVTEFPVTGGPQGIALGPDGNLWFTENTANQIGRITPSGAVMEFSAGMTTGATPIGIAAGPDGNVWFMGDHGAVGELGQVTPSGVITESLFPYQTDTLAPGADGNLWAAEPYEVVEKATQIIPSSRTLTEFPLAPPFGGFSESIAPGPDGNLWFTQTASKTAAIGRVSSGAPAAQVSPPAVSGGAQAGALQRCSAAQWSTWAGQQPSSSLFSFDGFRWLLDGSVVAGGPSYTPTSANVGHVLSCTEVVTYPLLNVTSSATSAPVTVVQAPVQQAPVVAPTLTAVAQSASVWREGSRVASLARSRRPPVGTRFTFKLNTSATVTLAFARTRSGRRVRGRCVGQTRSNRHKPSCKRLVTFAALSVAAHAGLDRIAFQGRLSRSKRLPIGRYTVLITAQNSAGRSQTRKLSFSIVR